MSDVVSTGGGHGHQAGCGCPWCTSTVHGEPAPMDLAPEVPPGDHWVVFERDNQPELWYGPYTSERFAVAAFDSVEVVSICEDTDSDEVIVDVHTGHGQPPSEADVLYGTDDHYGALNRDMAVNELFPNFRDAEEATEFTFDWGRVVFDEHNGYTAVDVEQETAGQFAAKVRSGDWVKVPGTSQRCRVAATRTTERRVGDPPAGRMVGRTLIWTEGQDPETDPPSIDCGSGEQVDVEREQTRAGLKDPATFNRELRRRVHEKAVAGSTRGHEPADVERAAHGLVDVELTQLAEEVLEARGARPVGGR